MEEEAPTRFCRQHLAQVLSEEMGGTQVLLRGLPGTQPVSTAHAVQSADWYHPVAELLTADIPLPDGDQRHARLAQQRATAEQGAGPPWSVDHGYSPSSTSCCRSLSAMRSSERNRPATSPSDGRSCGPVSAG